jgi:hypothetical protein
VIKGDWRLGIELLKALQDQSGALRLSHGCCMADGSNLRGVAR